MIPRSVVRIKPDGSFRPGMISFASTPAMKPMMIVQMKPMMLPALRVSLSGNAGQGVGFRPCRPARAMAR